MATDPYAGLDGEDRDVYDVISKTLTMWGVGGLADDVKQWLIEGRSEDWINLEMQSTTEFKKRFPAIANWKGVGSPPTPAEYLQLEENYKSIMVDAGINPTFYDKPDDFTKFIEGGVSPTEVQSRVQTATNAINNTDPNVKKVIGQWYTQGDLVAYALGVPADKIEQQYKTAEIGAAQINTGFGANKAIAERLQRLGIDYSSATRGLEQAMALREEANRLGAVYGEKMSDTEVVSNIFEQDAQAEAKKRRLASRERAQFSGSSGMSDSTLSARRIGNA